MTIFYQIRTYLIICLAGLCFASVAVAETGKDTKKSADEKPKVKASPKSKKTGRQAAHRHSAMKHEEELYEWLTPNFPDDAKKLMDIKAKDIDAYRGQLAKKWRKFREVIETGQKHPELGKAMTEDIKLVIEQDKILGKISRAKDEKCKAKRLTELKEIVSQRFDLGMEIKKMHYEILRKKIERLKITVAKKEDEVKRQMANRDAEIAKHVKDMLEKK